MTKNILYENLNNNINIHIPQLNYYKKLLLIILKGHIIFLKLIFNFALSSLFINGQNNNLFKVFLSIVY